MILKNGTKKCNTWFCFYDIIIKMICNYQIVSRFEDCDNNSITCCILHGVSTPIIKTQLVMQVLSPKLLNPLVYAITLIMIFGWNYMTDLNIFKLTLYTYDI